MKIADHGHGIPSRYLKCYNKKEMKDLYGVSVKTLNAWIEQYKDEIGPYVGKRFTVNQVQAIFNRFGLPPGFL